jgi:hypothetical protein
MQMEAKEFVYGVWFEWSGLARYCESFRMEIFIKWLSLSRGLEEKFGC